MSSNKCPICGNQGIPAYHREEVICPRCGSDLRVYKALYDVADISPKSRTINKRYKVLAIILPFIIFLLCGMSLYNFFVYNETISKKDSEVAQLRESKDSLTKQVLLLETELNRNKEIPTYFEYFIVHNDSPWAIVCKIYGMRENWEELSKQIAIDNDIWDEEKQAWKQIHPGQIIKVYKH